MNSKRHINRLAENFDALSLPKSPRLLSSQPIVRIIHARNTEWSDGTNQLTLVMN